MKKINKYINESSDAVNIEADSIVEELKRAGMTIDIGLDARLFIMQSIEGFGNKIGILTQLISLDKMDNKEGQLIATTHLRIQFIIFMRLIGEPIEETVTLSVGKQKKYAKLETKYIHCITEAVKKLGNLQDWHEKNN